MFMATTDINAAMFEGNTATVQPELLLAAVLHLMSHYTVNAHDAGACPKLAAVIERHLQALADLPGLAPVLRTTCEQSSELWTTVVERALPPPKPNLFLRLVAGNRALT
jgi:hypothetical protein